MDKQALLKTWLREEQTQFSGWDFSHVKTRVHHGIIPWDYAAQAQELLNQAKSALDMGTGGGEKLAKFKLPPKMTAVEAYAPNVPVAQKKLEPLGVEVIGVPDMQNLDLQKESFDLIINHHTEYALPNVFDLLTPGGHFFTQQVTGENLNDLEQFFDFNPPWHEHTLERAQRDAKAAGFEIEDAQDWYGHVTFDDVGALVYFLKAIPWIVDDFTVTTHQKYLFKLQEQLERGEKLEFSETRFLLRVRKPHVK